MRPWGFLGIILLTIKSALAINAPEEGCFEPSFSFHYDNPNVNPGEIDYGDYTNSEKFVWVGEGWMGSGDYRLQNFMPPDFAASNPNRQELVDNIIAGLKAGLQKANKVDEIGLSFDASEKAIVIFDWEEWALSYGLQQIPWGAEGTDTFNMTREEYNEAMQFLWPQILQAYRQLMPNAQIGMYNMPPAMNIKDGLKNAIPFQILMELHWLFPLLDNMQAKVYYYRTTLDIPGMKILEESELRLWFRNNMEYSAAVAEAFGKEWTPMTWPFYLGTDITELIRKEDLKIFYEEARKLNKDAVLAGKTKKFNVEIMNDWLKTEVFPASHGLVKPCVQLDHSGGAKRAIPSN